MKPTPASLTIEIHSLQQWRTVGTVRLLESEGLGLNARSEFCYDLDYASAHIEAADRHAVSCLVPVSFEPRVFPGWPPFLLDLFPQGAALQYVVNHYRIPDRPENYWRILATARLNPPGNLRVVATSHPELAASSGHPGFSRAEVISKGADFLEYMVQCGAPVAGATGAGGAAPKFLLREDQKGRFHADGTLDDAATKNCWLVKFPRGAKTIDEVILRAEAAYLKLAKTVGLQTHGAPVWEQHCLFIDRFDRRVGSSGRIDYLGLESFYSLAGKAEFGSRFEHETYLTALAAYSSDPAMDCCEYVLRDFFNVMVGNTDNHVRNSSVLKGDNWVRLAPLYDVAPMVFDPEGIVRNTRWGATTGDGDPAKIEIFLRGLGVKGEAAFRVRLRQFYAATSTLDELLITAQVPPAFIDGTKTDRARQHAAIGHYLETLG